MPPVASRDRDVESRLAPEKMAFFGEPKADRPVVSEVTGGRRYDLKSSNIIGERRNGNRGAQKPIGEKKPRFVRIGANTHKHITGGSDEKL